MVVVSAGVGGGRLGADGWGGRLGADSFSVAISHRTRSRSVWSLTSDESSAKLYFLPGDGCLARLICDLPEKVVSELVARLGPEGHGPEVDGVIEEVPTSRWT